MVIGSECRTQHTLGFVGQLATDLHERLITAGGWRPALGGDGPTLNPTIAELKAAVKTAFAYANGDRATLLIAFVGHGLTTGSQDFHLLAIDSPLNPDSDTAYHLTQGIREQLNGAPFLDGLIVLVDACDAGQGVAGAANRWTDVLQGASGRMELFVASGDSSAYDGCFTRTLAHVFNVGVESAGEYLLCSDLHPYVAQCQGQTPQLLSFVSGWVAQADPGLWLVPNVARRGDTVTGRSSAGLVDQLTRDVVITDAMRESLADLIAAEGSRLRVVVGSSGCGKSTLMSLLIRPALVDTLDITADYIAAAAFLDVTSTLESLSEELAGQLEARVSGFRESRDSVQAEMTERVKQITTAFEREIVMPLQRCRTPGRRVRIIIDGLDQSEEGGRDLILSAIADLTRDVPDGLQYVHVFAGVRSGSGVETRPELDHAHRTVLDPPTHDDLQRVLPAVPATPLAALGPSGGWLLARLVSETQEAVTGTQTWDVSAAVTLDALVQARFAAALDRMSHSGAGVLLTSLLVAAGVGPVLPIELAARILRTEQSLTLVRDMIVELGALVSRGRPGLPEETVGIAHTEFLRVLEVAVVQQTELLLNQAGAETLSIPAAAQRFPTAAHGAILSALGELESDGEVTSNIATYARNAAPRHYLAMGDADGAIKAMVAMTTYSAADNRDRWASWLPTFEKQLGTDHPATWVARNNHAYWRGEAGDPAAAVIELQMLVSQHQRALGQSHPDTFATRSNLARWRGAAGDVVGAAADLEALLNDQIRVLGESHPDTLVTRNNLVGMRAEGGAVTSAVPELEVLVREHQKALGSDAPNTLAARENLARRRAEAGDIPRAINDYEALLDDRIRVQGPDHPSTLATRNNLAGCRAEGGDIGGAITEYEALLGEQHRLLGQYHPFTLATRTNLAVSRAAAKDVSRGVAELAAVLSDQQRVLPADHTLTLTTRRQLVIWRKEAGSLELLDAIAELQEVLRQHERVLSADHPDTLTIRAYLAAWRGEAGDVAGAVEEFKVLVAEQIRVLGPAHPHTFATRGNLARCRGQAGDVAGAIRESEALLTDLTRVLGANHPHTQTARKNLEYWRRRP
ncbi:tetratricopeptide repeat protein [Mycobacterium sp. 1245852.3]|uniref:tetratricopeptide repeat protein n=1 Tax=Mycobacterium sp. 1245852.3 TaxID=1856860 RepID=UPI0012EADBA5|nr:tetratricopeptide repeat protein [Mycobacterium sp. 1245852.3]